MTDLAEEGWIAPAHAGPGRRLVLALLVSTAALLVAWATLATGRLQRDAPYRVTITETAAATVAPEGDDDASTPMRRTVRMEGRTRFVVYDGTVPAPDGARVHARVVPPVGVDAERIALRVVQPNVDGSRGRIVVTVPASLLPAVPSDAPAGALRDLTAEVDDRIAAGRGDRQLLERLRSGWWWIVPLGVALVGASAWLWRRAARRFRSMRRPGAGRPMGTAPPSSLDPISAAVLVAGARPVDVQAAFAGHVLDLVERRQLRLRRTAESEAGDDGSVLGLAHADDVGPSEDVAVAALRSASEPDAVTVILPSDPRRVRAVDPFAQREWRGHVAARARFERMVDTWPWQRVASGAAALATLAVLGAIGALVAEQPGARSAALLVGMLCLPLALVLALWAGDARRWRRVARARRTERAQWLAWRSAIGNVDAAAFDARLLPLAVATGAAAGGLLPERPPSTAVALDAVGADTVAALRAMLA